MAQHRWKKSLFNTEKTHKAKKHMKDAFQITRETQAASTTLVSLCLLESVPKAPQTIQSLTMRSMVKNGRTGNHWKPDILLEMQKSAAI